VNAGLLRRLRNAKRRVLAHLVGPAQAPRLPAALLVTLHAPELEPRLALGLPPWDARARQVVRAGRQVEPQLLVHLALEPGSLQEPGPQRSQPRPRVHGLSGDARRAPLTAAASRLHGAVSSLSRSGAARPGRAAARARPL
jgi:hypothetical protein